MKFPQDKRVKVDSTDLHDYYIKHSGKVWYIEVFPKDTLDHTRKTMGGVSTLKVAKQCVESWKAWMK
jgi:hypothetical protein